MSGSVEKRCRHQQIMRLLFPLRHGGMRGTAWCVSCGAIRGIREDKATQRGFEFTEYRWTIPNGPEGVARQLNLEPAPRRAKGKR